MPWPLLWLWVLVLVLAAWPGPSRATPVVDPSLPVAGFSQRDLGDQWWQWVSSVPEAENPLFDPDGSLSRRANDGPVFFLAGAFGGAVSRTIQVPQGRPLFFPLLNTFTFETPVEPILCVRPGAPDALACVLAWLGGAMDNPLALVARLDGVDLMPGLPSLRQTTAALFDLDLPVGNLYGEAPGHLSGVAAADGHWMALDGLPPGVHTLVFGGTAADGFQVEVTATLVVPEPPVWPVLLIAGLGAWQWQRRRQGAGQPR